MRALHSLRITLLWFALLCSASIINAQEAEIPITTSSKEALDLFIQGRTYQDNIRGYESISALEKAIDLEGNFAMAHALLAISQSLVGNNQEYTSEINKAYKLLSKSSKGEQLFIKAVYEGSLQHFQNEKELLIQLSEMYPRDKRAHYYLGTFYYSQGSFEQAITALNRSIEISKDFSPAYNMLGYSYMGTGQYSEAEKALKRYAELLPHESNPFDSLAEVLMKEGKFEESIETYRKAIDINRNFTTAYTGIATNYILMNEHEKARKELQEFYDGAFMDSQKRQALYDIACSYIDEGKFDQALDIIKKRLSIDEKTKKPIEIMRDHFTMGDILAEWDKSGEAAESYKTAAEICERSELSKTQKSEIHQRYLYSMTCISLKEKDIAKARQNAEKFRKDAAVSKNQEEMRRYHELLGLIAFEEKKYEEAVKEFGQGQQDNPRTMFRLADAYLQLGDKNKAKQAYERAANYYGNSYDYHFIRTKAFKRLAEL